MKKLTTVILLLMVQTTTYAQDNPLLKLRPFTGQWNYTETVSNSGQQNGPTVKTGTATIYFTPDSSKYSRKVEYTKPVWEPEKEKIMKRRDASNRALKSLDDDTYLDFLTDDVLITTGNGTLLSGKDELKAYVKSAVDTDPMYWIRTPEEVIVNEERGLAWETGVWHGYSTNDPDGENSLINGKYSAQWTNASGEWKIQSQLFVTTK